MRSTSTSGMTLIELLVVLAILAAVTGIALTTAGETLDHTRYEETARRLDMIEKTVVGDGVEPGRFVQDMGRLPRAHTAAEGERLSELWQRDASVANYGEHSSETLNDSTNMCWPNNEGVTFSGTLPNTVTLRCGWNGPYLTARKGKLFDGFGNAWETWDGSNWECQSGEEIQRIRSLGKNGLDGGTDWIDKNQPLDLNDQPSTTVTITMMALDRTGTKPCWRPLPHRIPPWQGDCRVALNQWRTDSTETHLFKCTQAGRTGASEPMWDTDAGDPTNSDGTVNWECIGQVSNLEQRLRVALFTPAVDGTVNQRVAWDYRWQTTADAPIEPTVTLDGTSGGITIYPGARKIYVYSLLVMGTNTKLYTCGSQPQAVTLSHGSNSVTMYLQEQD